MKKLLAMFLVSVYSVAISMFVVISMLLSQDRAEAAALGSFVVPLILMLVVCVFLAANIVGAIISALRSKYLSFRVIMVFKLCIIPFYIINFVCWGIASVVFHIALIVWPLVPFVIGYTYFTVIGTSAHNIAHLVVLRRTKKISTKQCILHSILQLIFVVDVIDSIILAIKQKKLEAALDNVAE